MKQQPKFMKQCRCSPLYDIAFQRESETTVAMSARSSDAPLLVVVKTVLAEEFG